MNLVKIAPSLVLYIYIRHACSQYFSFAIKRDNKMLQRFLEYNQRGFITIDASWASARALVVVFPLHDDFIISTSSHVSTVTDVLRDTLSLSIFFSFTKLFFFVCVFKSSDANQNK